MNFEEDAAFIAAAREAIPALIGMARERDAREREIRRILASWEVVSLPHDFPTVEIAKIRMTTLNDRTKEGLALIGKLEAAESRATAAEARVKELEAALQRIDESRYAARTTVTPETAFDEYTKLNRQLVELCDEARLARMST